jgi:hypothetical protein
LRQRGLPEFPIHGKYGNCDEESSSSSRPVLEILSQDASHEFVFTAIPARFSFAVTRLYP